MESKFFNLYWHYFVAGLAVYICARLTYNLLGKNIKNKKNYEHEDLDTPEDQILERRHAYEDTDEYDDLLDYDDYPFVPLQFKKLPEAEILERSEEFYKYMNTRRSVRHFSTEDVPVQVIYNIIKTAGTSPSGGHTEPWTYVLVRSPEIKEKIREIVEEQEEINYKRRMSKVWLNDLKQLKTNYNKAYLTEAPYLILVFKQSYSFREDGRKQLHYYNEYSIGLSAGILLTAIHYAGLVSITSTPLNCGPSLRTILGRPKSEKLILLLPVGYPAENCMIPDLKRKSVEEILVEF